MAFGDKTLKVTKKGKLYAVVKESIEHIGWSDDIWFVVDVASGTKLKKCWSASDAKWYLESLENGYDTPESLHTSWNSEWGQPIDMPASLKKMQKQILNPSPKKVSSQKPIGSTSTSIVDTIDSGTHFILKMDDGTFGVLVPSTGESKMGFKTLGGAKKSAKSMLKKMAGQKLGEMGVDAGSDAVDTLIKTYEGRVRDMYGQAAREMAEKQKKFMGEFRKEQQDMLKSLGDGVVTQKQYDAWLREQTMMQDWYRDMVDSLSNDLVAADKRAMEMLNGYVPRAYAENMNFATFQIEGDTSLKTGFSLYNESTVARLVSNPEGSLLPKLPQPKTDELKDAVWSKRKINACVTQSILQGESVPDAAKRLASVVGMSANSAMMAARTTLTAAQNLGRLDAGRRAKEMGIELKKQWIATVDSRTRYSHRGLDRETVELEEAFSNGCTYPADPDGEPQEVCNCFVGDTLVSTDTKIEHGYRRMYSGKLVTIKTASGVEFTCTPNHPILTASGWVGAEFLHEGDDILITSRADAGRSGANPDVHHVMASFETVHELLRVFSSERRGGLGVDFHGDGTTADIEVVGEERLLRVNGDTSIGEGIAELALEGSDTPSAALSPLCKGLVGVAGASSGGLGCGDVCLAFLDGELFHSDVHGIGAIPMVDASIGEHAGHKLSGTTYPIGDGFLGLTREIRTDNIISVDISHTNGTHVYNLQTSGGYYFVSSRNTDNAIIAHNCRCAMRYVLPGHEYDDLPDVTKEGIAYDEWKNEHMTKLAAQKDKLQAQLDDANAHINDLKKLLPEDKNFQSKFGTNIIDGTSQVSKWSEQAVAQSEDYYFNKLQEAIAKNNQYDIDWYKKRLLQLKEYDDAGRAYHDVHMAIEPQLQRWQNVADKSKEKLAKLAKSSGGFGNAYTEERLKNAHYWSDKKDADAVMRPLSSDAWLASSKSERYAAYHYTQNYYEDYNMPLNGFDNSYGNYVGYGAVDIDNQGEGENIRRLTRVIERSVTTEDMWLRRGTGAGEMDSFFGFPAQNVFRYMSDDELQGLVGTSARVGSFLSTGTAPASGAGFSGEINLEIFVPAGSQALYCEPFSAFGGSGAGTGWDGKSGQTYFGREFETLLQRGGSYTCIGIERTQRGWTVKWELHPEDGYDLFQQ